MSVRLFVSSLVVCSGAVAIFVTLHENKPWRKRITPAISYILRSNIQGHCRVLLKYVFSANLNVILEIHAYFFKTDFIIVYPL